MCGICGIIVTDPSALAPEELRPLVERMTRALSHRGPDDEGITLLADPPFSPGQPAVALGHRRLSIIDLQGGHQPLANEDESVWTAYNGEVYNFPELRSELAAAGHTFATRSDTECLVHLYEDRGTELVQSLRGMYAFAVWDERERLLLLARDRLGQKPLYFMHDRRRGIFAFASELKALLEIPGFDRTVSPDAIDNYLTLQYVPHPMSIFRAVRKLPPAHWLTFRPETGRIAIVRYWRPSFQADEAASPSRLREELREELTEATRLRLISDVPLGAFLSGGVDSSITVALMSRLAGDAVRTFSVGFDHPKYDETRYARLVARHCRTDHTEETVRPSALEVLPKLVWHYDEPFGDSSAIPTYYVSQMASKHVKVVLTGDAGDECFAGYPRYVAALLGMMFDDLPPSLRWVASPGLWSRLPVSTESKTFRRRLRRFMLDLDRTPEDRYLAWISMISDGIKDALCTGGFRGATGRRRPAHFIRGYYDELPQGDFVQRTTYVDLMTYLPCDLLTKVDIASMAHGLEARSPFLDHKVVELAWRIPRSCKLRLGALGPQSKAILKETFADLLPRPILTRPKMGFGVPISAWFRGELSGLVRDVLLARPSLERGYFEPDQVRRLIEEHTRGAADHGTALWLLLMLELWHLRFIDGEDVAL